MLKNVKKEHPTSSYKFSDEFILMVKQDGMYSSEEIILTNDDIEELKNQGFYQFNYISESKNLRNYLYYIYIKFMSGFEDTNYITIIDTKTRDKYIITKDEIKNMNSHLFI